MSASLVGSEMCIRDRRETEWGCGGQGARNLGAKGLCFACVCRAHAFASVSYTHLTLPTICSV
eukprot:11847783-Alexandrium_andersonii.AAC.1